MNRPAAFSQRGITLVEIIATLVVFGLLASYLVSYINSTLPESHMAYIWVNQENDMGNGMETIISDYIKDVNSTTTSLDIGNFSSNLNLTAADYSTVTQQFVCFNDAGDLLTTGCLENDVLMVSVTDPNGRQQHSLFTQTRTAAEPYRMH